MFRLNKHSTKVAIALLLVMLMVLIPLGAALAAQPGVDCNDFSSRPGHAQFAPGSAFNPDGNAGTHYAGEQPQNSGNIHSVSQYDVACEKVSQH